MEAVLELIMVFTGDERYREIKEEIMKLVTEGREVTIKYRAAHSLFSKLRKAEERAAKGGWISAEEMETVLGVNEL